MEYALWALVFELGIVIYVGLRAMTLWLEGRTQQLNEEARLHKWRT